jgi:tetratricopeptide (TPR) repeat protein
VTPRRRVLLVVALAALAAVAATLGATRLYDDPPPAAAAPAGTPPLLLDLGVREDAQAQALRQAASFLDRSRPEQARAIFERYPKALEARAGLALVRWPRSSTRTLEALARDHPRSAFAQLQVGLAHYWEGDLAAAEESWRAAERVQPDSLSAVRAEDLLHPDFARGRPTFVASRQPPAALLRLSGARQLAALARGRSPEERLWYGVALQRIGRPVSARRAYEAAARLAPRDPEAQVAAAVGRFDKDDPAAAFSRLGPLSKRFPQAPTVRFHLGLLLLWSGQVEEGKRQLGLVRRGPLAREAARFLERLG